MTKTRLRRLLIFAIAAVLLLFVARAGLDLWASRRVDAAVARLEQRYGSLHEGTLILPPVPAGDNRARAFRAAAALIDLAPLADQRGLGRAVARMQSERAAAPLPADLRAFVDANRAALRVANEARTRRESDWEADYILMASTPPWMEIRTLSNALHLAARRDLDDGRADDAAAAIASGLALSASVRQEPNLLAQLLRCAFGMQHFDAVQRLVTHAEPSKASLEELARWLAEDRAPRPMDVGLLGELRHFHAVLTRFENGERRVGALRDLPWWIDPVAGLGRPLVRVAHARYLNVLNQLLEIQMGPRPRPDAAAKPMPSRWSFLKRMDNLFTAGLERTMKTGDLFTTQHGLTELAVALRRFRLDHGQYPETLSALMPDYLPALPMDASTGQPPVYTREGTGFRLRADLPKDVSGQRAIALDWAVPK